MRWNILYKECAAGDNRRVGGFFSIVRLLLSAGRAKKMKDIIPISVAYIVGFIAGKNEASFYIIFIYLGSFMVFKFGLRYLGRLWKIVF